MRLDGVLGSGEEVFDAVVRLDRFERQFDLAAACKEPNNGERRQGEVGGREGRVPTGLGAMVFDAPGRVEIVGCGACGPSRNIGAADMLGRRMTVTCRQGIQS